MKDKHKNLKNIDLFTELTPSEQEQINGGWDSATSFVVNPPEPPPPPKVIEFAPSWPGR